MPVPVGGRGFAVLVAFACLAPLSACGTDAAEEASRHESECRLAAAGDPKPDSPSLVVVTDQTASNQPTSVPSALDDALKDVQMSKGTLKVIGVGGEGEKALQLSSVALDPKPDNESAAAKDLRKLAIACAIETLRSPEVHPKQESSDILEALAAAGRETPDRLVIWSDGMATAGALDFGDTGVDGSGKDVAKQLRRSHELPDLKDVAVVWVGLGETTQRLGSATREGLQQTWTAVLDAAGAEDVVFETKAGDPATGVEGLPDDPIPEFKVDEASLDDGVTEYSVPSAILFGPDDADLADDADETLQRLADQIVEGDPSKVLVVGHTADYRSEAFKKELSEKRARAVKARLVRLGVPAGIVTSKGVGSTQPRANEWPPGGGHDLAAAAANRRVTIQVVP